MYVCMYTHFNITQRLDKWKKKKKGQKKIKSLVTSQKKICQKQTGENKLQMFNIFLLK